MQLLPVKRGVSPIPQVAFQQRRFLRAYLFFRIPSWGSGELAGKGVSSIGHESVDLIAAFGDYKGNINRRARLPIDGLRVSDGASAVRVDLLGASQGLRNGYATNADRSAAA